MFFCLLVILLYGIILNVWDFIGDIHGMAGKLKLLLAKLGYKKSESYNYQHPGGRKVIFLGDYIDRGPNIVETLRIVKTMHEKGSALALLGNHEFNLLCYTTKRQIKKQGQPTYVRRHNKTHSKESANTRAQFSLLPEKGTEFLQWFYTLPLYLESAQFFAAHASYMPGAIAEIRNASKSKILPTTKKNALLKNFAKCSCLSAKIISSYPNFKYKKAIDAVLKGNEVPLPAQLYFFDNDKNERTKARVCWWLLSSNTQIVTKEKNSNASLNKIHISKLLMIPKEFKQKINALPNEEKERIKQNIEKFIPKNSGTKKPIFFGHYWMHGKPKLLTNNKLCLDFSVARNGHLVAYRFNNEKKLLNENLVWV